MSILLVSKNRQLGACLRDCFARWGCPSLLEVKNEGEAESALNHTRRHIRLVFVDGDLESVDLSRLQGSALQRPAASSMIWGWIHRSSAWPLTPVPAGFHFAARRPFAGEALMKRLFHAAESLRRSRSELIYLCSPRHLPNDFPQPNQVPNWSEMSFAHSATDLQERFARFGDRAGALWIDARDLDESALHWLRRFRKTFLGAHLPWVCVGRSPERTYPVRTLCQIYLEGRDLREEWIEALRLVGQRAASALEIEFRLAAFRHAMKIGDLRAAGRFLLPLLSRMRSSFETEICAGELMKARKKPLAARDHLIRSLEIHPCNPGAYAQLLSLHKGESDEASRIARTARDYCPGCRDLAPQQAGAAVPCFPQSQSLSEVN